MLLTPLPFLALSLSSLPLTLALAQDANSPLTPAPTPTPTPTLTKRQVAGGSGTPILSTLFFPYTALPTQVYPFPVLRGPQFGYNQCGAANATATADCQTLVFNNASDFCLWGSPDPNGAIGDVEAKVVSYCTNPQWGGRPIPPGALHGVQFMRTSAYIQIVGFIDNTALGLASSDTGGELDPHGADLQGNPLGGVVYSTDQAFIDGTEPGQVHNWNLFVGSGVFCLKACFNSITSPDYCENRYDLVGCEFNMPNSLANGTFEACEGALQTPVGTYVSAGQTLTWSMPDPLTTDPPYTPVIPSSSNCRTFASGELFASGGSGGASGSNSGGAGSTSGAPGSPTHASGSGSGSNSANPSQTGTSGARAVGVNSMSDVAIIGLGVVGGFWGCGRFGGCFRWA
ncbi:macrophage activating glycoprotein [Favolaschia claudopus]|uniref:Macrophage activating glycoprotein n=1 Tax=Favolaschia claudopus TaxID=2862362 RepID=A0AAW0D3Q3_9AGAR